MIIILTGTRPEIIKMAPVIVELTKRKIPYYFVHSGQHYTKEMDADIIRDLDLKQPDKNLGVGSGSHAVQTGRIMEGVEQVCLEIKPKAILVHGDTNTTLAGALVAKKLHIPVAHIEAGLRSFDYTMPEEVNRILVDRISDILFAPTKQAQENLLKEGITKSNIVVTGNTVVDAVHQHLKLAQTSTIVTKLNSNYVALKSGYILLTAHRPENVDSKESLEQLIKLLKHVHQKTNFQLLWPIHPRAAKNCTKFGISLPNFITVVQPAGYIDMLQLISAAQLILTDSGGIQEEAYLLHKPLMTLRPNTERPETLSANYIIHFSTTKFDTAWNKFINQEAVWGNELGSGTASTLIVDTLIKRINHV